MIKIRKKTGIEKHFLSMIKYSENFRPNIILSDERLNTSSVPRVRNKTRMLSLTTSINIQLEILTKAVRKEKDMEDTQTGKEEVKLYYR